MVFDPWRVLVAAGLGYSIPNFWAAANRALLEFGAETIMHGRVVRCAVEGRLIMDSGLHEHQNVAKGNGWFRAIPVCHLEGGRDISATCAQLPARRPPFDFAQGRSRLCFPHDGRERAEGERAALQAVWRGALE